MPLCPACALPLRHPGAAVADQIDGKPFAALLCAACIGRLDRLPAKAKDRWLDAARNRIGKHPERYAVRACESDFDARLIVTLASDSKTAHEAAALVLGAP